MISSTPLKIIEWRGRTQRGLIHVHLDAEGLPTDVVFGVFASEPQIPYADGTVDSVVQEVTGVVEDLKAAPSRGRAPPVLRTMIVRLGD